MNFSIGKPLYLKVNKWWLIPADQSCRHWSEVMNLCVGKKIWVPKKEDYSVFSVCFHSSACNLLFDLSSFFLHTTRRQHLKNVLIRAETFKDILSLASPVQDKLFLSLKCHFAWAISFFHLGFSFIVKCQKNHYPSLSVLYGLKQVSITVLNPSDLLLADPSSADCI